MTSRCKRAEPFLSDHFHKKKTNKWIFFYRHAQINWGGKKWHVKRKTALKKHRIVVSWYSACATLLTFVHPESSSIRTTEQNTEIKFSWGTLRFDRCTIFSSLWLRYWPVPPWDLSILVSTSSVISYFLVTRGRRFVAFHKIHTLLITSINTEILL